MSQNYDSNGNGSPLAQVFQDAYQKAMTIRRLDEQINQLVARRKAVCEELRQIQSHLNEEFTRLTDQDMSNIPGEIPGGRVMVSVNPNAFQRGQMAEVA